MPKSAKKEASPRANSEAIGTVQVVISDYENGKTRPHAEAIIKIAQALGVSADELLGLKDNEEPSQSISRRILRRMQALATLPEHDQKAVFKYIDLLSKQANA